MAQYPPPSANYGVFNTSAWEAVGGTALTIDYANEHYCKYNTIQGPVNIPEATIQGALIANDAVTVSGSLNVFSQLNDGGNSGGLLGQVLTSTGASGVVWQDSTALAGGALLSTQIFTSATSPLNTLIPVTLPAGTAFCSIWNLGSGTNNGPSFLQESGDIYVGGGGSAGSYSLQDRIPIGEGHQLNIFFGNTSTEVSLVLQYSLATPYPNYPDLTLTTVGTDGTGWDGTNFGIGGVAGVISNFSTYVTSFQNGVSGAGGFSLATPTVSAGSVVTNNVLAGSLQSYCVSQTVSWPEGCTDPSQFVYTNCGTGCVIINAYSS